MSLEKYEIEVDSTKTVFEFISEGPKGSILKGVYFSKMKVKGLNNVYNLAFGDKNIDSGDIDDQVITDNQDRDTVLATVANTVVLFSKYHPKAQIFITGSNPARTRLYQMAISKYFDELSKTFVIKGFINNNLLPFEKNVSYIAFLISRKTK